MADGTRPFLVEVTGVAGSGKSTLARLLAHGPEARLAGFIQTRDPRHLWVAIRTVPRLLPILARNVVAPPRLSWADAKLLAYVAGWHRVVRGYRDGMTVFDQGPLYALVRLRAQGRGVTRTAAFARWWDDALARWSRELSAVVYLDAEDPALLERIGRRAQAHATKGQPQEAARGFLERYRALFEETLGRLERLGGPEIVRLDSGAAPAERLAADLAPMLADRRDRRAVGSEGRR
jgi:thymidylate kinase